MSIFGKVIAKKQRVPDFMEHGVYIYIYISMRSPLNLLWSNEYWPKAASLCSHHFSQVKAIYKFCCPLPNFSRQATSFQIRFPYLHTIFKVRCYICNLKLSMLMKLNNLNMHTGIHIDHLCIVENRQSDQLASAEPANTVNCQYVYG